MFEHKRRAVFIGVCEAGATGDRSCKPQWTVQLLWSAWADRRTLSFDE